MRLYYLFWMFMDFIIHFYIIFGTNLLTRGPSHWCFIAYFSVSQKRNIKRSPNGMKPLGELFLEQTQSRTLGVAVKKHGRKARGRGTPSTLMGPPLLHRRTSFAYIYPYTLKTSGGATKPLFHRRNFLYQWDPILGPFPELRQRQNRSRRASTSTP